MADELRWGQEWVRGEFERVATSLGIQAKVVDWDVSPEDFDRGVWSLRFAVAGNSRSIKFSEEELEDAQGTTGVTSKLTTRLVDTLRALV